MTRIPRRGRWLAAALLAGVAACVPQSMRHGAAPPLSQQTVLRALNAVKADDEQRAKVLGAYETARPKLEELRDEAESLRDQVHELAPRAPDYLAQTDKLAGRLGDIAAEQARVQSRFVHEVAVTLTDKQWEKWLAFFRAPLEEDYPRRMPEQQPDRRGGY